MTESWPGLASAQPQVTMRLDSAAKAVPAMEYKMPKMRFVIMPVQHACMLVRYVTSTSKATPPAAQPLRLCT